MLSPFMFILNVYIQPHRADESKNIGRTYHLETRVHFIAGIDGNRRPAGYIFCLAFLPNVAPHSIVIAKHLPASVFIRPMRHIFHVIKHRRFKHDSNLFIFLSTNTECFLRRVKLMCTDYIRAVLVFLGGIFMPKIHIGFIQVVAAIDCIYRNANLFCKAAKIPGICEFADKMHMGLFQVAFFMIVAVFFICIFIMQRPRTGEILLTIFNLCLLALWIQNKHTLTAAQ